MGGIEAADRLVRQVQNYVHECFDNDWDIVAHVHLDVPGLLSRLNSSHNSFPENNVHDFMRGFNQADRGPLLHIVDAGSSRELMHGKVEGKSAMRSEILASANETSPF